MPDYHKQLDVTNLLLFTILAIILIYSISYRTIILSFPSNKQIQQQCARHKGISSIYSQGMLGENAYIICRDGYGDFIK